MSDNAGDQATMGRYPYRLGELEEGIAFWVVPCKDHEKTMPRRYRIPGNGQCRHARSDSASASKEKEAAAQSWARPLLLSLSRRP